MSGFYHIWAWRPSWSCDQDPKNKLSSPLSMDAPHKIWLSSAKRFQSHVYSTCVRSVMLHAAETWTMTVDTLNRLRRNDRAMIRWICNGFHRIIGPVNAYPRPSCHFFPCFHVCLCFQNRPLPTLITYLHLLYQLFASITFQFSGCNSFQKITF